MWLDAVSFTINSAAGIVVNAARIPRWFADHMT